jgi:hypothetical protein
MLWCVEWAGTLIDGSNDGQGRIVHRVGQPIPGWEQKALQLFNETLEYYGRLQQQGDIESFEPILLEAHRGELGGFLLLRGDADRVARLRTNAEFIDVTNPAQLLLNHVGVVGAWYCDKLQQLFASNGRHIAALQ